MLWKIEILQKVKRIVEGFFDKRTKIGVVNAGTNIVYAVRGPAPDAVGTFVITGRNSKRIFGKCRLLFRKDENAYYKKQ